MDGVRGEMLSDMALTEVRQTCITCPNQWEGRDESGRPFYFRARHGLWTLDVGVERWPVDLLRWPGAGERLADGVDEDAGYFTDQQVIALLEEHLGAKVETYRPFDLEAWGAANSVGEP